MDNAQVERQRKLHEDMKALTKWYKEIWLPEHSNDTPEEILRNGTECPK